mmetsp:Transcript_13404/g.31475  ORF Transcript_13404/g.31475 Transcript_13404/m.31475 type:complete len:204 (+) Transcript_13404:2082-2693(+)
MQVLNVRSCGQDFLELRSVAINGISSNRLKGCHIREEAIPDDCCIKRFCWQSSDGILQTSSDCCANQSPNSQASNTKAQVDPINEVPKPHVFNEAIEAVHASWNEFLNFGPEHSEQQQHKDRIHSNNPLVEVRVRKESFHDWMHGHQAISSESESQLVRREGIQVSVVEQGAMSCRSDVLIKPSNTLQGIQLLLQVILRKMIQ